MSITFDTFIMIQEVDMYMNSKEYCIEALGALSEYTMILNGTI